MLVESSAIVSSAVVDAHFPSRGGPSFLLFVVGRLTQNAVPEDPCYAGVARVKAPADTLLGEVRKVLGIVAPPGAVVIPQMVERVVPGPDGEDWPVGGGCSCAHRCDVVGDTSGTRDNKKAPP